MRLLSSDGQEDNVDFIRGLLNDFVIGCGIEYGREFIAYNVHNIVHLPEDYEAYGNLEKISAFQFESFLGRMKNSVKSGYRPLRQVCNFAERHNSVNRSKETESSVEDHEQSVKVKKVKILNSYIQLGRNENDCHILMRNGIYARVENIYKHHTNHVLIIREYGHGENFFTKPVPSKTIGIAKVTEARKKNEILLSDVYAKCVCLQHEGSKIMIVLLHTVD